MTGNPYIVSVRTPEILDKLEQHPIWQQRAAGEGARAASGHAGRHRRRLRHQGLRHRRRLLRSGASKSTPDGRISIHCDHVEMGNGIGTALANRVALHLGGIADEVAVAQVDAFDALGLVTSGDPYTMDQKTQDAAENNPRWVPAISSATSASIGAHVGTHAAAEAARVDLPLRPVAGGAGTVAHRAERSARQGLGQGALEGRPAHRCRACRRWRCRRSPPTRMRAICVTGAMAHGFSPLGLVAGALSDRRRAVHAPRSMRSRCARAAASSPRIDRASVKFPPTDNNRIGTAYTSMCGTLVRVEIERATGALRIAKAYSVLECGQALVPEVVLGQAQGGFAMGVGYALLETLPPYEGGPGNGQWNLGQYLVARGSDLPLHDLEIEMLPPLTPDEPPKGMAEVVMIPVVPALLNAIFDATGHRFQSLPVTQAMLKGALA